MKLESLLLEKKTTIVNQWIDLTMDTYPADTKRFLKQQKDQFANPVGTTLSKELENLFDNFLDGINLEKAEPILDRIIRIRAIQDFSPSQATKFIFFLKGIINETLKKEVVKSDLSAEVKVIESRVDELILLAFDIYMRCREKLSDIRANESKNRVSRLLQRADLISEIPQQESD